MRSDDTHPEAARIQLELLRQATPAKRFSLVRSLSSTVIGLSRQALRRAMPGASEREVLLRWVELHYGLDLARAVRADLDRRDLL